MTKTLLTILVLLLATGAWAQPNIEYATGTVAAGEEVTVVGTLFGTHTLDIEWTGDWIEQVASGTSVASWGQPQWSNAESSWPPTISNVRKYSGTKSIFADFDRSRGWWQSGMKYLHPSNFNKIYATFWVYFDPIAQDPVRNTQWKMWRINHNGTVSDQAGQVYWSSRHFANDTTNSNSFEHQFMLHCNLQCPDFAWNYCFANALPVPYYAPPVYNTVPEEYRFLHKAGSVPWSDGLPQRRQWNKVEFYIDRGAVDTYNGTAWNAISRPGQGRVFEDYVTQLLMQRSRTDCRNPQDPWRYVQWQNYWDDDGGSFNDVAQFWYDDIYIQFGTQARIEIGDNAVYADCTYREIQVPTEWSADTIKFNVNLGGSFTPGQTLYAFVINSSGTVSNGVPIEVGSSNSLLMHSSMGSATAIHQPEVAAATYSTQAAAIPGAANVTYVTGSIGNAAKVTAPSRANGDIQFLGANFDFFDVEQDGGRLDMLIRYDSDPQSRPNDFLAYSDPTSSRYINFEMTGTAPNARPVFFGFSSDDNSERRAYDEQGWAMRADANQFGSYWADVDEGDWVTLSYLWRNNGGTDRDEVFIFIDGELAGSDFNGNLPNPVDDANVLGYVALAGTTNAAYTYDEIWSFDSWDVSGVTGSFATLNWPEDVYLKHPLPKNYKGDTLALTTSSQVDYEFMVYDATYSTSVCSLFVDDTFVSAVTASNLQHVILPDPQALSNGDHTWQVRTNRGTESDVVTFTMNATLDTTKPALSSAAQVSRTSVDVTFSEEVSLATANDEDNYAISGGLTVTAANRISTRVVRLTISAEMDYSTLYTITVNDVEDLAGNAILANSTVQFTTAVESGAPVFSRLQWQATWNMRVWWYNGPLDVYETEMEGYLPTKWFLYHYDATAEEWVRINLTYIQTVGVSGDESYTQFFVNNGFPTPAWYVFWADAGGVRNNAGEYNLSTTPTYLQVGTTGISQPSFFGERPVSSFVFSANYLEVGFQSTSTDSDTTSLSYAWDFGDGVGTSNVEDPVYTYAEAGSYQVSLRVTNSDNLSDTSIQTVTVVAPPPVNVNPVANFTWSSNNLVITFTDTSTDSDGTIASWAWDFGDASGTSTVKNPVYGYAAAGSYTVSLTVTDNDGGTHQVSRLVSAVSPPPVTPLAVDFEWDSTFLEVAFTDLSVPQEGAHIIEWLWTFGDGLISNEQNPVHYYDAPGTYTVLLRVADAQQNDDFAVYQVTVDGVDVPSIPAALLAKSHPMVDIRSGANWYDNSNGSINTGGDATVMSAQDKADVADVGLAYLLTSRGLTNTGQSKLAEFVALNPDFRWVGYLWFNHIPATEPAGLSIPLQTWEFNNLPKAYSTAGDSIVAWYVGGDPENEPLLYTANTVYPNTGGRNFNKDLIDAWIEEVVGMMADAAIPPIGLKLDYFTTGSQGPPQYDYVTYPDLNQNGTAYNLDAGERAGHLAAQEYVVTRLRQLLGPDFILIANGRGTMIDQGDTANLRQLLNGQLIENWPRNVWQTPATAWLLTYAAYISGDSAWDSFRGKGYQMMTHGKEAYNFALGDSVSVEIDAHRLGALMFDGWHKVMAASGSPATWNSNEIVDAQYEEWRAMLRDPISAPVLTGLVTGVHSYSREFWGGTITVEMNGALSNMGQIVDAYVVPRSVGDYKPSRGNSGLSRSGKASLGQSGLIRQ